MERKHFSTLIQSNRKTTIPILKTTSINFLDLNMPVMGGFLDCFSSIDYSDFNTTTNVVILSSTIDPEDLEKANKYPMVIDFLSKPLHSQCWITYQKIE
jgi:CheY-like chemotaxis protein